MTVPAGPTRGRLQSLDAFRGLTIAWMILVNNPGSWAHIHAPLRHAPWNGWTPTDLVFPFFLFIVGAAMAFSFSRRIDQGAERADLLRKIGSRSLWIFGCGLLLNGYPFGLPLNAAAAADFSLESVADSFANLRVLGVLQRIALCYLFAGLAVVLIRGQRGLLWLGAGCLGFYEILMRLPLVSGWGGGSFELENNLVRWLDLRLLGENHLWHGAGMAFDPEGLISTLPAVATTLLGYLVGVRIRQAGAPNRRVATQLIGVGVVGTVAGLLLSRIEPINKQLWSSSYMFVTGGLATLCLVGCWWLIDGRGIRTWARPAIVFGSNPLIVFVGSGLLARTLVQLRVQDNLSVQRWIYTRVFQPVGGDLNGSLLHAAAHVLLWLAITWWLYRRRLFLKI